MSANPWGSMCFHKKDLVWSRLNKWYTLACGDSGSSFTTRNDFSDQSEHCWKLIVSSKVKWRVAMFLLSRLSAGCDQAYHLTRGAQDRRPGWSQHSHSVERCSWGPGVPTQERTDPQVTRPVVLEGLLSRNAAPDILSSVANSVMLIICLLCYPRTLCFYAGQFVFVLKHMCEYVCNCNIKSHHAVCIEEIPV